MRSLIMKSQIWRITCLSAAALLICAVPAWAGPGETFVPINYPGATTTSAAGINGAGDIVGSYSCVATVTHPCTVTPGNHAYLLRDGVFTPIDVPGAVSTIGRGISKQGIVVGQYGVRGADGVVLTHGFAYSGGNYVYPIDVPPSLFDEPFRSGHLNTIAVRMSPRGVIVGCFHEDGNIMTSMRGFVLRDGTFTRFEPTDTMHNGITPSGKIVGFYFDTGVSYLIDREGNVNTFRFPGDLFTLAWDISARGDIVGEYVDSSGKTLGFLRTKHGEYQTIKVQGASLTRAVGINASGDIVGQYVDATGSHGYVRLETEDE